VPFLTEFLGRTFDTRRLQLAVGYDGRDRPLFATRGSLALARVDLAGGPLGGDLSLVRARLRASRISPLDPSAHHLIAWSAWWERVWPHGETSSEGLPRFERLFLGGELDLRGFPVRGVGPISPENVVVGGDQLAYLSVEYGYAPRPWLRWVSFLDAGNVWAGDFDGPPLPRLRADAGAEIQLQAPFFGLPLRAGYAFKLKRLAGESRGRFFFALAARF
jgi:outer membrane protein assembly factor BamA